MPALPAVDHDGQPPGVRQTARHARGVERGARSSVVVDEDHAAEPGQARQLTKRGRGYGAAGKPQVQQMIKTLLKLPAIPQVDASDALAIALCHCYHRQFHLKLPPF